MVKLKEWKYIKGNDHVEIGYHIKKMQREGWSFHTYSNALSTGSQMGFVVHYLLFEKDVCE